MPPKQINSDSDSGEDYYDDFSKYKKRHMNIKKASSSDLPVLECSTSKDKDSHKLSETNLTTKSITKFSKKVSLKGIKKLNETKAKTSGAISELCELDEELADLLDSPPVILESRHPVIGRKCDKKLENILLATKNILNDAQCWEKPGSDNQVSANGADDSINFEQRCTIVLKFNGQTFIVRCNMDDQFHKIIKENATQLNIEANKVILMGKDCRFYPEQTPEGVGLDAENLNEIDVFEDCGSSNDMVTIKWLMKGKKPIVAKIMPQQTFLDLKEGFCKDHGLDPKKTRLVFDAETLANEDTPESLGIEDGDCIDVYKIE